MYEYRMEGEDIYRFNREDRTADAWNQNAKAWQPCPERYDDLVLGFYYEKDDPHWIQTFKCITEDQAKKLMAREWSFDRVEAQPKAKPNVTKRKQPTKAQQKKAFREFLMTATQVPKK